MRVGPNHTLTITSIQRGQLGQYTCVARNQAGQRAVTASIYLSGNQAAQIVVTFNIYLSGNQIREGSLPVCCLDCCHFQYLLVR